MISWLANFMSFQIRICEYIFNDLRARILLINISRLDRRPCQLTFQEDRVFMIIIIQIQICECIFNDCYIYS